MIRRKLKEEEILAGIGNVEQNLISVAMANGYIK